MLVANQVFNVIILFLIKYIQNSKEKPKNKKNTKLHNTCINRTKAVTATVMPLQYHCNCVVFLSNIETSIKLWNQSIAIRSPVFYSSVLAYFNIGLLLDGRCCCCCGFGCHGKTERPHSYRQIECKNPKRPSTKEVYWRVIGSQTGSITTNANAKNGNKNNVMCPRVDIKPICECFFLLLYLGIVSTRAWAVTEYAEQ